MFPYLNSGFASSRKGAMHRCSATVMGVLACVLIVFAGPAASQQAYPAKPVRLIVPFPPGGAIDIVARVIGQQLSPRWQQAIVVDNRPGANGIIAAEALAKSPADGYTIIIVSSAHLINPLLLPTSYDVIKDFAAIGTSASSELLLAANPSVPANNLQEFIALAKARPSQLNYASSGNGNINHLAAELFNMMAGIKTQHVPYKGTGPSLVDLIGGQVQIIFSPPSAVIPGIRSGKLKAIAVSGKNRLAALPDVPTFTESGLANFDVKYWFGFLAPARTPKAIIDRLSSEIAAIVALPEVNEKLVGEGLDPFISNSDQFAALMEADLARFGKIIKTANIKLDQ